MAMPCYSPGLDSIEARSHMGQRLKVLLLFSAALLGLHFLGFDVAGLPRWFGGKVGNAVADTQALFRGEYSERTATRLRAEAELKRLAQAVPVDPGDSELHQELAAERRRLMEAKAQAASQGLDHVMKGDIDGLKRQVEQQAALAAEAAKQQ
jgi:hypothetical protein